jgi:2-amino-4-hydroxy-6-hydroxymethyldihydropteridine diphosphokinase
MPSIIAYIGLGSNQGERAATIIQALTLLDDVPRIAIAMVSQLISTAPVGGPPDQPDFLNGAAEIRCAISVDDLFQRLQDIENRLGRTRAEKWGQRYIDLDLLLFGSQIIDTPRLKVPHPLMHQRSFVLTPLVEIAPDLVHPVLGKTMRQILADLET